jgi:uncharacterized protein
VTDSWKLGRKGVDDGVLFVVAMQERKMRIHTGRGVQGTLTDALSKRIVAEHRGAALPHRRLRRRHRRGRGRDHEGDRGRGAAGAGAQERFGARGHGLGLRQPALPRILPRARGRDGDALDVRAPAGLGRRIGPHGPGRWCPGGSLAIGVVAALVAFVFTLFSERALAQRPSRRMGGGVIPGGGWGGGGGFGGGGGGFSGGGGRLRRRRRLGGW